MGWVAGRTMPSFRLSVRVWLILLALFPAVPITGFAVFSLYRFGDTSLQQATNRLERRSEAAAIAVGQRLDAVLAVLTVLASSEPARHGEIQELYDHARRILPANPVIMVFSLVSQEGRQLFNTLRPFGEALPPPNLPEAARAVFETGQPYFGGPFLGTLSQRMLIALAVPVTADGQVRYCLRANMTTGIFLTVMAEQNLLEGWTWTLLSGNGDTVFADSRTPEETGKLRAEPAVAAALAGGRVGLLDARAADGSLQRIALARVPSWNLAVAVAVPVAELEADPHALLFGMMAVGGALLMLGCAVAYWLSRHLARQVSEVSSASAAFSHDQSLVLPATSIRELNELGNVLGVVKEREERVSAELSHRILSEQQLAEALAKLEATSRDLARSNAELEHFAYVASHDLRQPLRMVSSYLGLIEKRLKSRLEPDERGFLEFALDGARRMDKMIVGLLDYSRLGRSQAAKEWVGLDPVMAQVIETFETTIAETGAEVTVAPGLPQVWGAPSELGRLFQNLVGNALKFRVEGRPPRVAIAAREQSGEWVIEVRDNGIGIDSHAFGRLFNIFQRLVPADQYEGSGIGLASCRKIAENHGGRIWVESEPNQGSAFFVAFPKRRDEASCPVADPSGRSEAVVEDGAGDHALRARS